MGTPAGLFLANVAFLVTIFQVGVPGFVDWAWRIPFLLSALLVAVGLFIRVSVGESPSFAAVKRSNELEKLPVVAALKGYWRPILLAVFTIVANAVAAYVFLVFSISYGTGTLHLSRELLLLTVSGASLIWLVSIPFWTRRADSNGRRRIFIAGSLALLVASAVFFPLLDTASTGMAILAYGILGLIVPVTHSLQGIIIADIFPPEMRYSGFGLTLGGSTILAGLAPLVASSLLTATGATLSITVFMVIVCAISTVSALALFRSVPDMDRGHQDTLTPHGLT